MLRPLDPLFFAPIYKDKLWGGSALATKLGRAVERNRHIGESWDLSGYPGDVSICESAPFAGKTLTALMHELGTHLTGSATSADFPLLYKFIDANDKLSVQVHPDDAQSRAGNYGAFGKTECWYVADAKPGATIICGVKPGVTGNDIRSAIADNSLEQLLNVLPATKGDMLFVPAGTVHAICADTLIYEVQQSSDTTFRLYDWGRLEPNGKPRQLHIEESLRVLDASSHNRHIIRPIVRPIASGVTHSFRVACRYFAVEEYSLNTNSQCVLAPKKSFQVITVLNGSLALTSGTECTTVGGGTTVFLPASIGRTTLFADQQTTALVSSVPDLKTEVIDVLRQSGIKNEEIELLGGNPKRNDLIASLE